MFGGKGVLLLTPLKFILRLFPDQPTALSGIKRASPASNFYQKHKEIFKNAKISFSDPYRSITFKKKIMNRLPGKTDLVPMGGFGSSSAQFTLLYKLYLRLQKQEFSIENFLDEFHEAAQTHTSYKPSGADIISQYNNRHTLYDSKNKSFRTLKIRFTKIGFAIFKTGVKISTHEHLANLGDLDFSNLISHSNKAADVFLKFDKTREDFFISELADNVNEFYNEALKLGIVIDTTQKWINALLKIDGVRAVKGCGAGLADTIVILFDIEKKKNIFLEAQKLGLFLIHSILPETNKMPDATD